MGSGTKVKEKKLTHQDDSDEERKSEPTSTDINASELPPHILLEMTALSPTMNQGNIAKMEEKRRRQD
ncbi:hypothetical protein S83_034927 [Arachis hypogaea]